MKWKSGTLFMLSMHAFLSGQHDGLAAQKGMQADRAPSQIVEWNSANVQHIYGLPDAKPKDRGALSVSSAGLSFTGKANSSVIPLRSIIAVGAGNERVELWGMKGRILRMAMPHEGGLVAAAFMHHRVDMLTVEFNDSKGGYHGAVFFVPAKEADDALLFFANLPTTHHESMNSVCESGSVKPRTVLVPAPNWDQVEVPAAYRALVYEHLVERLLRSKGSDRVYRDGENDPQQGCPQYTIRLSITGFKAGSQVQRAWTGPVGMFAGTTQMVFDAAITDASGKLDIDEQTKATIRGESESINVADGVARKLTKQFASAQRKANDGRF